MTSEEGRLRGTIKSYDRDRGFGFIRRDTNDPDVFVHVSELQKANLYWLAQGQRVAFEIVTHDKGPRAANVQLVVD